MLELQAKLEQIKWERKLNSFLGEFLSKTASKNKDHLDKLAEDVSLMNKFGVKSEEDIKHFWYSLYYTPVILKKFFDLSFDKNNNLKIAKFIYENLDKNPINTLESFAEAVKKALFAHNITKFAYPMPYFGQNMERPYNIEMWAKAMKEIYYNTYRGIDSDKAFDHVTNGWSEEEKFDFKRWMKFYQKGEQLKYKMAQEYYMDRGGAPLIPMDHLRAKFPAQQQPAHNVTEMHEQYMREDEIKEKIKAVIGRLQSAEKIVTDPEVQKILNEKLDIGLDKWLETLHLLKRKIQTVPIKNAKSLIFEDLIIQQGNKLINEGHKKAGLFLKKFAQEKPQIPNLEELPPLESAPTETAPLDKPESKEENAMDEFVKRLNFDEQDADDIEVKAQAKTPLEHFSVEDDGNPMDLPQDRTIDTPETVGEKLLEVDEDKVDLSPAASLNRQITVASVIKRLETVDNILRNREIPRQLAMVDLEMDVLGIASFFPTLAEAARSALESHSYMISRIDDILSKLRGAVTPTASIDLTTTQAPAMPGLAEKVKENLAKEQQKEDEIKELRKQKRKQQELEGAEPAISVTEDLNQPVNVAPTAPPVPPKTP